MNKLKEVVDKLSEKIFGKLVTVIVILTLFVLGTGVLIGFFIGRQNPTEESARAKLSAIKEMNSKSKAKSESQGKGNKISKSELTSVQNEPKSQPASNKPKVEEVPQVKEPPKEEVVKPAEAEKLLPQEKKSPRVMKKKELAEFEPQDECAYVWNNDSTLTNDPVVIFGVSEGKKVRLAEVYPGRVWYVDYSDYTGATLVAEVNGKQIARHRFEGESSAWIWDGSAIDLTNKRWSDFPRVNPKK